MHKTISNCRNWAKNHFRHPGLLVCCLLCSSLAAYPYLAENHLLLFSASACAAFLFFRVLVRFIANRSESARLSQFLWLLEFLAGKISSGTTLEKSLLQAAEELAIRLGQKRELSRSLLKLKASLEAQMDLNSALLQLSRDFPCLYADRFLRLLAGLRQSLGQPVLFISNSRQMLYEQLAIQRDIRAEQNAKFSEAAILTLMPFGLAWLLFLGTSQYKDALHAVNWSLPVQLGIFALAAAAACLALQIMTPVADKSTTRRNTTCRTRATRVSRAGSFAHNLRYLKTTGGNMRVLKAINKLYLKILPWSLVSGFSQQLPEIYPQAADPWLEHLSRKLRIGLTSLICATLLVLADPMLWLPGLILLIAPVMYHDRKLLEISRRQIQAQQLEYPVWLNSIALLLASGLSLQRALELACNVQNSTERPPNTARPSGAADLTLQTPEFARDMRHLQHQLAGGLPAAKAVASLMRRIAIPQVQTVMQLMIRYDRDGGSTLLELIQVQASNCWQVQKAALRKRLDRKGLLLLIPMGMDLAAVLATAIIPAVASLEQTL